MKIITVLFFKKYLGRREAEIYFPIENNLPTKFKNYCQTWWASLLIQLSDGTIPSLFSCQPWHDRVSYFTNTSVQSHCRIISGDGI